MDKKFTPFTQEDKIEPLNSLGLRYKDKVIGWMINHRIAPDTIRYTQMYVHPDYQPLSRSILFLAKAIEIHSREVKEVPKATFRVETHNTPMCQICPSPTGSLFRRNSSCLASVKNSYQLPVTSLPVTS